MQNIQSLEAGNIIFVTISENPILEKLAVQLVQNRQLRFGTTGDGGFLGEYSATSVEVYGKEPGAIQLYDQGDFYESMHTDIFVTLDVAGFFINADGDKDDVNLFEEYGEDITKLNEENLEFFKRRFYPKVIEVIEKMIFANV